VYSINGVALHDSSRGWRVLRAGTSTQGGITKSVPKVAALGQDGYTPAPTTTGEQIVVFVVRTKRESLEQLLALCDAANVLTLTAAPDKVAYVQLNSAIPSSDFPLDRLLDVTITLSIYQGMWRRDNHDHEEWSVTSPIEEFLFLGGISAPVRDADICLSGVFGEFTLTDSNGSWLKTTSAWAGSSSTGLLFRGRSGQAFTSNILADPFVPIADVSGKVDVSGNGGFRITPYMFSGDPADRTAKLTLTTLTQTSVKLWINATNAYRMN